MALGEQEDFRSKGFQQVNRFPGQDHIGGTGSPMLQQWTQPSGSTNLGSPVPPLLVPSLGNSSYTFPGFTLPAQMPPIVIPSLGSTTGTTSIGVYGGAGTPTSTPVSTIHFIGSGLVNVTVAGTEATVEYQDTGGSGGGTTTLIYGKITSTSRISAGKAAWAYTVLTSSGSVTARNLLEKENTTTSAYGYTINPSGTDRIVSTSYYIYPVPINTWVRMELTTAVDGVSRYWFSAPNYLNGGC